MMQPPPISGILWTYETDGAIVSPVISAERSGRNQMPLQGPKPNPVPLHYCPHCHTEVMPERRLITPHISGHRVTPKGPEWHCNSCGTTFAPDYFDEPPQ